jgi:NAD-dependent SIR2 family protein deacetylase
VTVVAVVGSGLAQTAGIDPPEDRDSWSYWESRMQQVFDATPTRAHRALAALFRRGDVGAVITDSDDMLLEEVGIDAVRIRPNAEQSYCPACGYSEPIGCLLSMDFPPLCAACGAELAPGPLTEVDPALSHKADRLLTLARQVLVIEPISRQLEDLVASAADAGAVRRMPVEELIAPAS